MRLSRAIRSPRLWPLVRVRIVLEEDGQILVDLGRKFRYEKEEWNHPESYLKLEQDVREKVTEYSAAD